MRTNAHNTLSALALAIALAFVAASAQGASNPASSGYELAPRTDTRADFLVAWHDDERIVPRHIRTDEQGNEILPRHILTDEQGNEILAHHILTDEQGNDIPA